MALFCLSSVMESFEWFWMGSVHKNIQFMPEFLKGSFLVQHLSYYTLMTFLMMLFVILLSMLMILLYTPSVIRHLICGNNYNWLLNLNLIYVDWVRNWLFDFNAGKAQLVSFDPSNTGANHVKMDGSVLKMLGLSFFSKLDRGCYIISIAKTTSKKIGALIQTMNLLSISINLPYSLAWNTVIMSGLVLLAAT